MPNWAGIAYVVGGLWALGFLGSAFTAFFEVYLARADPRWLWVPALWACAVIAVSSVVLTVVGYLGLTEERRTFTYTFHSLAVSSHPFDQLATQVAAFALVVFPIVLVLVIIDLKTCWTVCP